MLKFLFPFLPEKAKMKKFLFLFRPLPLHHTLCRVLAWQENVPKVTQTKGKIHVSI